MLLTVTSRGVYISDVAKKKATKNEDEMISAF